MKGGLVRIGVQSAIWSSDDFKDLGGGTPVQRCLREIKEAGYAGTELGHKFPREAGALHRLLDDAGLSLVSGWHGLRLVKNGLERERPGFSRHLSLLKALGCSVAIVSECTGEIYTQAGSAIIGPARPSLPADEWRKLAAGLEVLAAMTEAEGMSLVYHPRMGTLVQGLPEIDRLMGATKKLRLLADTGHLAFAGVEPIKVFRKYKDRIGHVHLKDVRTAVLKAAYSEALSFEGMVRRGVFTVPGEGRIDFAPIFAVLAEAGYEGWMVIGAEQDPQEAQPLCSAKRGRDYVRRTAGL